MADNDLQSVTCGTFNFLSDLQESGIVLDHDGECQESLCILVGELNVLHGFLHMGVILSPEMEDFIDDVLHTAQVWLIDHQEVLTDFTAHELED